MIFRNAHIVKYHLRSFRHLNAQLVLNGTDLYPALLLYEECRDAFTRTLCFVCPCKYNKMIGDGAVAGEALQAVDDPSI